MALSHCLKPGCPELTEDRRCNEHRREYKRTNERALENVNGRRSAPPGFYASKFWKRKRKSYMERNPKCETKGCENPTREVDHVKAIRHGGGHEDANLQALCKECHSSKTAKEVNFAGKRKPEDRPKFDYPHRRNKR